MAHCTTTEKRLRKAIEDYLLWMIENRYSEHTVKKYEHYLAAFADYAVSQHLSWDNVFEFETMQLFYESEKKDFRNGAYAIRVFSRYLYQKKEINCPITKPRQKLPEVYESYFTYIKTYRKLAQATVLRIKQVLKAFHAFTQAHTISLLRIKIEHIDSFFSSYNATYSPESRNSNRTCLRGFLKYLYYDRGILKKDLAPFVRGSVTFANAKPPKFFRPDEVKQLFEGLGSNSDLRQNAMIYIGFALGLRPIEISLLDLDHINFSQAEVTLVNRKNTQPIKLPIPETTLKAIALYIIYERPKTEHRALFVKTIAPYDRMSPMGISNLVCRGIKKTGLKGSGYWLRHTYAQTLLETGAITIYEIKEMMGHDRIQTTERYIHIDNHLMRKVLFNETV